MRKYEYEYIILLWFSVNACDFFVLSNVLLRGIFVLYLCDFLHVMYIGMMLFTMTCSDSLSYVIQAVGIRLVLIILLILMEVEWSTVYSFSLS